MNAAVFDYISKESKAKKKDKPKTKHKRIWIWRISMKKIKGNEESTKFIYNACHFSPSFGTYSGLFQILFIQRTGNKMCIFWINIKVLTTKIICDFKK